MSYINTKKNKTIYNVDFRHTSFEGKELLPIYQEAAEKAVSLLNSVTACVFLISDDKNNKKIKTVAGVGIKRILGKDILIKDSNLQFILKLKETTIIYPSDSDVAENMILTPPLLVSPINVRRKLRGFLAVCDNVSGKKYSRHDIKVADLITSQLVDRVSFLKSTLEHNDLLADLEEQKERYLKLYENSNAAFFWLDSGGKINDVNGIALKILGYTKKQLLSMKIDEITKDERLGYAKLRNIRKFYDEVTLIDSKGNQVDVEISLNKIRLKSRIYYIGTARDITDKKILERQIKHSRYKFMTIIDGIKDGILLLGKDLEVLAINKEQAKRSNVSATKAVGKHCSDMIHKDSGTCDSMDCSIKKSLRKKKVHKELLVNTDKDSGAKEFIEVTTFPLLDSHKKVVQVMAVLRDVTNEKNMHHRLIYSEKLATLGTLSAKIGHEIRNPLTAILACAQYLEMKDEDNKNLKIIISEGFRLQSMVNDLLTISKPKAPSEKLIFLEKVIEDVIGFLKNVTGQIKYHNIIKEFDEIPPVIGDEEQLKQLFTNIILNASQAMEEVNRKEGDLIIGTKLSKDKKYSITYVTDCGKGINKKNFESIFDPFFTTKGEKGTGLGMAVAKEIIDSHNGKIEIKSKENSGTTMSISLPAQPDSFI